MLLVCQQLGGDGVDLIAGKRGGILYGIARRTKVETMGIERSCDRLRAVFYAGDSDADHRPATARPGCGLSPWAGGEFFYVDAAPCAAVPMAGRQGQFRSGMKNADGPRAMSALRTGVTRSWTLGEGRGRKQSEPQANARALPA